MPVTYGASMLTHPLLDHPVLRHGFFTREGGVSTGIYASLNCGPGSNDAAEAIAENRRRAASAFGLKDTSALITLSQIHSAKVHSVTSLTQRASVQFADGDALVTDQPGMMLGILTADCGPVLFADPDAKIIGAAHAGWKGALGGIIENTVSAMCALGASRPAIHAVLGPCIAQASYEVDDSFRQRFCREDLSYDSFFANGNTNDKWQFDLKGFIHRQLIRSGLTSTDLMPEDTYRDEQQFFSYRRTTHRGEPGYGRQLSALMLR